MPARPKPLAQQQFENQHSKYQGDESQLPKLQAARKAVLDKEGDIARIQGEMAEKREQIDELNVQILAIKQGVSTDKMTKYQSLQRALSNLSNAVENWKLNYLLKSPADGIVYYYNTRRKQQYVQKSEKVLAIVPFQETDQLVGELELPTNKAGQIEAGQLVYIKLDKYPFREHGIVEGLIENKAELPREEGYFIRIALPNGLQTKFGENLTFRQQMEGKAEIITQNKRFAQRVLDRLIEMF